MSIHNILVFFERVTVIKYKNHTIFMENLIFP